MKQKRIKHPTGWDGKEGWECHGLLSTKNPLDPIPEYSGDIELGTPFNYQRIGPPRLLSLEAYAFSVYGIPHSQFYRSQKNHFCYELPPKNWKDEKHDDTK